MEKEYDFDVMFKDNEVFTPDMAVCLYMTLCARHDEMLTSLNTEGMDALTQDFDYPSICYGITDKSWWTNIILSYKFLIEDLENGRVPLPMCPAEEVAIHLCKEEAVSLASGDNPAFMRADTAFTTDDLEEALLEDLDILSIFDMRYDGIDSPDNPVNTILGMGNMNPMSWFNIFYDCAIQKREYNPLTTNSDSDYSV